MVHSQVIFLTGSGGGVGRAIAEAALDRGHQVIATTKNPATVADLTERHPDRVQALALLITDREDCAAARTQAIDRFGRIDAVINTAGYAPLGAAEDLPQDVLRALIDNNLFGTINVTQALIGGLRRQGHGRVIQVASVGGRLSGPGLGAYTAAQEAIAGFSAVLDQELRPHGVRVTFVEPAPDATGWATAMAADDLTTGPYASSVGAAARRHASAAIDADELRTAAAFILDLLDDSEPPQRISPTPGAATSRARDAQADESFMRTPCP